MCACARVCACVRRTRGGSTAVMAVPPWCYHGSPVVMGVPLRSQGGILANLATILRCHCVPTAVPAVPAVLLRFLYGNVVSTEVAMRCLHGATAGIFCGRHGVALLPQRQRSSSASPVVALR